LDDLLLVLNQERFDQLTSINRSVPILVKLNPDFTKDKLDDALDVILSREKMG